MPRNPFVRLFVRHILLILVALMVVTIAPHSAGASWAEGLRPLWISVGGAGGGGMGTDVGQGYGTVTVGLRLVPIVPEVTLREGVSGEGATLLHHHGNIALGARILLPGPPFLRPNVRFAFSHRHDAPIDLLRAKPFGVLFGTTEGIAHRAGFETGAGVELNFGPERIVGLFVPGTLVVLPPANHELFTGLVEAGVTFSLGPLRPSRADLDASPHDRRH